MGKQTHKLKNLKMHSIRHLKWFSSYGFQGFELSVSMGFFVEFFFFKVSSCTSLTPKAPNIP